MKAFIVVAVIFAELAVVVLALVLRRSWTRDEL